MAAALIVGALITAGMGHLIRVSLEDREVTHCRSWLPAVTQGRLARVQSWLERGLRNAAVVAGDPETSRVLAGRGDVEQLTALMNSVARGHGFRRMRLRTSDGHILAQVTEHVRAPSKLPFTMDIAGGVASVELLPDPRVGYAIVFRQPVTHGRRRGIVEIVDGSVEELARLMAQPRGSPMGVQTFLVFPREPAPVVVSSRKASKRVTEAVVRLVHDVRGHSSRPHFAGITPIDGGQRFAAVAPVPGTRWWIVATVGRKRVLAAADSRASQLTWLTGSLLAVVFALGLAGWRHARMVHFREIARSQTRYRAIFETAPVALFDVDLTEVRAALRALQKEGATDLARTFEHDEDAISRIVERIRILSANEAAAALYGVDSADDVVKMGAPVALLGRDAASFGRWLVGLAAGESLFEAEISLLTPLGENRTGLIRILNPSFPDQWRHTVISILDITSKKRAEVALEEAEQRYRTLFEGAADAIFIHDFEGRILEVNDAACRQLGSSPGEIVGMTLQTFTSPAESERIPEWLEELRREGRSTLHSYHVAHNGRHIPVEINSRVINYRGQTALMSIVRDVTQREEALAEIRFLNRLLEIRSRANRIIVTVHDRSKLFEEVCNILVDEGGFGVAWVVTPGGSGDLPRVTAASGPQDGFVPAVRHLFEQGEGLSNLCDEILQSGNRRVIQDLLGETGDAVGLRHAAIEFGYRSMAFVPIERETGPVATLAVGSRSPNVFSEKVMALLEEIGADLGFALEALETQRALQRSEERYRLLFERNVAGVYRSSVDGRMLDCNEAFARIFGFESCRELLQAEAWDLYPDREVRRAFLKTLFERGALAAYEQPMQRRDGSPLWIVLSAAIVEDERGEPREIEGTLMDLTERRRVEEDFKRTAQRLEEAQRIAHVGNWEWDPEKDVSYWSAELYRIAGLEPRPFNVAVSRSLERVHPEDRDRVREAEESLRAGEDGYTIEYRILRPDGTARVVLDRARVVRDTNGRPLRIFGTVQDLTEYRGLEEQLRQAQKMEAIGRLAGGVAHDFNNILQAMMMFTDELDLRQGSDSRHTVRNIRALKEQIERAASLTRQLLLFSRRETSKPERLDLNEVVSAMTAMLQRLVREDIQFSVTTGKEPIPITADRSQIEQVVMNLVVNAVDAMPDGGRLLVSTVCHERKPGWACLRVVDTGRGIPEDIREHIFDPFFTTKEAGQGTGLGLSVVHGIVTGHGGRIDVASTPGKGTTFTIRLPLAQGEQKEPSGAHPRVPEPGRGEHVLLVEDNPAVREGLQDTLTSLGYVVTALDSAEAAEAFDGQRPDVLLTDQILPGRTGLELTLSLKQRWPGLAVILMSGYSEDEALKGMVGNGHIRFLQKPAPLAQLAAELRAALDESRKDRKA